eukprot:GHVS01024475.1.p1 GENE.GHVS01024475.1~~GHVS01024475.1.p1  ORF type:complete len:100 (-),score=6.11 GHVS01024475.1:43-342(-)
MSDIVGVTSGLEGLAIASDGVHTADDISNDPAQVGRGPTSNLRGRGSIPSSDGVDYSNNGSLGDHFLTAANRSVYRRTPTSTAPGDCVNPPETTELTTE